MGVKAGIAVHATQRDDAKKVENPPLPQSLLTRADQIHALAFGAYFTGHGFDSKPTHRLSQVMECKM